MFFNEESKPEIISELFHLFSLIVNEENYIEDQKVLLAQNDKFFPESAFIYMANYQNLIKHSISSINDESHSVDIFDPNFVSSTPIQIKEKKYIGYENLFTFFEFNDCCEIEKSDLENFKGFYFPSNEKGFDFQNFVSLLLPYSNKIKRKNCLKRKILYELNTLESLKMDLKLQTLISQIFEDEIQLFKRIENIKIKLINKLHWDPIEAFNNLDQNSLGYLDLQALELFFKNFDEKLSPKDFKCILKRINKNSELEQIYFEDFKKLVLPYKTYFTNYEKILPNAMNFSKSQVLMERVDHSINDDKYLILKSTVKNEDSILRFTSPSKIRQAIFADSITENNFNNNAPMAFSTQNSRVPVKTKSNMIVSNLLNVSQKPIEKEQKSLYISRNEGSGRAEIFSRCPGNKIIQDLYGEHQFMNLKSTHQTPMKDLLSPIAANNFQSPKNNITSENIVNPITNFDNERLLKTTSHEKKIYSPMRHNPQLISTLNNELNINIRNENPISPLYYSTKKPLFYSNTKEMQKSNLINSNSLRKTDTFKKVQTVSFADQSASFANRKKIFDNESNLNRSLNLSIEKSGRSPQKLNEPEISKRHFIENNPNSNVSKPTPPLII